MLVLGLIGSVDAVTLRVQTTAGDSVFYAPVGDTVSVAVSVDSGAQALAGVEVFLGYDSRLFDPVDVQGVGGLLGRVLVDTALAVSDSVSAIHVAEADLVGRSVTGRLFTVVFRVKAPRSGFSSIDVIENSAKHASVYTEASRSGVAQAFDTVHRLQFGDLPPVLLLPVRFGILEDEHLVIDLSPLAQDAESNADVLNWQVTSSDSLFKVTYPNSLTVEIVPSPDFFGTILLTFAATDPAGGAATRIVPLRVEPVNDPPEIVANSLPDSVILGERNTRIELADAAIDIDGDLLVWSGEGEGGVSVGIEEGNVAQLFAPLDWVGEGAVVLRVSDPDGESTFVTLRVIRAVAFNTLPGDFDGNGEVGFTDFLALAQAFGQEAPSLEADLNGDGRVDFGDFLILVQNFGRKSN